MISRVARLAALGLVLAFTISLGGALSAHAQPQPQSIEGRITGLNTDVDPPIVAVQTNRGQLLLRAPNMASVVPARIGDRFRARGTMSGDMFIATEFEAFRPGSTAVVQPFPGGIVGRVTGLDTTSDPGRALVRLESGATLIVLSSGPAALAVVRVGDRITAIGERQGDTYRARDLAVVGRPR